MAEWILQRCERNKDCATETNEILILQFINKFLNSRFARMIENPKGRIFSCEINEECAATQLVHQCSWQQWIRSSLACSSESVKIWKSWKWGGHGGPWWVFFLIINNHLPTNNLEFHARSSLGLCVPGITEGPKRPLKRPFHTLRTT